MQSDAARELARREAVRCASAILSGELGVLEGSVAIAQVADRVVPSWFEDPDFAAIGGVASECDGLLLGDVRHQWQGDALARMDAEAQRYTDQVRDTVVKACENIVARFGDRDEDLYPGSVV
jgi:hypothetical protein